MNTQSVAQELRKLADKLEQPPSRWRYESNYSETRGALWNEVQYAGKGVGYVFLFTDKIGSDYAERGKALAKFLNDHNFTF